MKIDLEKLKEDFELALDEITGANAAKPSKEWTREFDKLHEADKYIILTAQLNEIEERLKKTMKDLEKPLFLIKDPRTDK